MSTLTVDQKKKYLKSREDAFYVYSIKTESKTVEKMCDICNKNTVDHLFST